VTQSLKSPNLSTVSNRIHKELGIGYGTAWNYVRALEQA
jgi:hypothetical protein